MEKKEDEQGEIRKIQQLRRQNAQLRIQNSYLRTQLRITKEEANRLREVNSRNESDLQQIQRVLDRNVKFFEKMEAGGNLQE